MPLPAHPPSPQSDAALVEAFRRGDEFAFASLYERYKGPVYAYCAKMVGSRETGQDLLQETFARAYEHRERLVATASFKAWLFTIARNQCLNWLRRAGREVPFPPDAPEPAGTGPTPFTSLLRSEQAALVDRTLAGLSAEYREVVVLREYQNLSYEEIAAVTKTTVSSVKSRLFKARRKIATALRPWLGPPEPTPTPAAIVATPPIP